MAKKKSSFGGKFAFNKRKIEDASYKIGSLMGAKATSGDVGIEVEVEGNKFPVSSASPWGSCDVNKIPKQWEHHHDGSLRGLRNAEYVLKKPLKFADVGKAVDDLWQMFNDYGSVLDDSNRTSVHVHLNAQDWHLNRLTSFLAIYFCVEDILTHWCGDHRVGNLFCLRAKDATDIVYQLKEFIKSDGKNELAKRLHYGGLNCHALVKYGSIEIRALRGVTDPELIKTWVSILERIYKLSGEHPDPRSVCEGFSGAGPLTYLQGILGDYTQQVVEGSGFNGQQLMESMYEGIRLAQDLCYCRDWTSFKPKDIKADPFGRSIKQVQISIDQAASPYEEILNTIQAANTAIFANPAPIAPNPFEVDDVW